MSKAKEWARSSERVAAERPTWRSTETEYCVNPHGISYSKITAYTDLDGDFRANGLTNLRAHEAIDLAKWIIDTFGEGEK